MITIKTPETEKILRKGTGYSENIKIELSDEDFITHFKETTLKYTKLVSEILENSRSARNDDRVLYFEVLRVLGYATLENQALVLKIAKLKYFPTMETIRRIRQKLNEQHLFLPDNPYVIEMRKKREKAYRTFFKRNDGF